MLDNTPITGKDAVVSLKQALFIGGFGICTILVALFGCTWCKRKWQKFKERRHQSQSFSPSPVALAQHTNEFMIFPPQSISQLTSVSTVSASVLDEILFEPLPEIRSRSLQAVAQNVRPARFTGLSGKISLQDWFDEHQTNFPRNQLKYLREVGSSWYGQAVDGEACNILPGEDKTRVVVKILRVDAAALEYMQFLHEARPYRDLRNPHLLHLIGQCLEVHPFLLIMEHADMDLKTWLFEQRKSPEVLLKCGLFLQMACNVASAIQYMHEHGYIHCDVAAHSCVVTANLMVKVGDYGTSLHVHKSDYYCLGDIAFPLRWCAPESLHCTESIIEAKDVTREANVWSFGVFLWELLEFGKLPYMDFSDDEIVQKVIIDATLRLEQPKTPCIHKDLIFRIMYLCWLPPSHRPSMQKVCALLSYLYENKDVLSESTAFESRWNALQPVLRNHNLAQTSTTSTALRFETDFNMKIDSGLSRDCDSIMSSELSHSQYGDKSPSHCSLSTGYEGGLLAEISPSLQNLRGSIEDLTINSASTNEETDVELNKFSASQSEDQDVIQKTITEAIRDLDIILSAEVTSSDTSKCTTPEKSPGDSVYMSPQLLPTETSDAKHHVINGDDLEREFNIEKHSETTTKLPKQNGDVVNGIVTGNTSGSAQNFALDHSTS